MPKKSKAREKKKQRSKNKPKKPLPEITAPTQIEVDEDSEEEAHPVTTWEPAIKTEATVVENEGLMTTEQNIPWTSNTKAPYIAIRRGSRNRPKPDFFGNNVMVGNVETPKEEPQPVEQEPGREWKKNKIKYASTIWVENTVTSFRSIVVHLYTPYLNIDTLMQ